MNTIAETLAQIKAQLTAPLAAASDRTSTPGSEAVMQTVLAALAQAGLDVAKLGQ